MYGAERPPDLVIEQFLMLRLKTTGGLTRGRGMTYTQRIVWALFSPVRPESQSSSGKQVGKHTYKKKNQAITMDSKSKVSIDGENVIIDPSLHFQRLVMVSKHDRSIVFKKHFLIKFWLASSSGWKRMSF